MVFLMCQLGEAAAPIQSNTKLGIALKVFVDIIEIHKQLTFIILDNLGGLDPIN